MSPQRDSLPAASVGQSFQLTYVSFGVSLNHEFKCMCISLNQSKAIHNILYSNSEKYYISKNVKEYAAQAVMHNTLCYNH